MKILKRFGKGTIGIVVINIVVYILISLIPDLAENMLLSTEVNVIIQKPWTLVTVFFSHEILIHIVLNMLLLLIFGSELEKTTNKRTVFAIYILAGLSGSFVIIPVSNLIGNTMLIAGASASVFGIVAAYGVLRPDQLILRSKAKWWVISLILLNVVTIFIGSQTSDSSAAHLIGIFVGLAIGYLLKRNDQSK
ncbi:MAG: rhomboid family intramembrane serine protease [Clostridiales bacterium]|nr:rhomboid family intramembrane serine protease [Clostridiales bacterium]